MEHICEGLTGEEICDNYGDIWVPCEAEICDDPCLRTGLCTCPCHN